jgi:hypothetical protein
MLGFNQRIDMQLPSSTNIDSPRGDPLQGITGWLLIFIVLLPFRVFIFITTESSSVYALLRYGLNWPLWVIISRALLYLLETALPLWISYLLASKHAHAVIWTKVFLALSPLTIAISYFHDHPFSLFYSLESRVFLTLFAFAIPWFVYFSKSKRVRNTYMFTKVILPSKINCPFCSVELALSDVERTARSVECPECHGQIEPVVEAYPLPKREKSRG